MTKRKRTAAIMLTAVILAAMLVVGSGQVSAASRRFTIQHQHGLDGSVDLITDSQTGVQYIAYIASSKSGQSMTVLLDAEGKPYIDPEWRKTNGK